MEQIEKIFHDAIKWIKDARINKSPQGWGDSKVDQQSTLINTSEALLGLIWAGEKDRKYISENLLLLKQYIRDCINAVNNNKKPIFPEYGNLPRQICWAGIALIVGEEIDDKTLRILINELENIQNEDGGWGPQTSNTFSTSLVLWFLSLTGKGEYLPLMRKALHWLEKCFNGKGWGWEIGEKENAAATSYALIALHYFKKRFPKELKKEWLDKISKALNYLEEPETSWNKLSGPRYERIRGMKLYTHFTLAWALIALISWQRTTSKKILNGIRRLLSLRESNKDDADYGGFRESEGENPKTWATMQAIFALRLFLDTVNLEQIIEYMLGIKNLEEEIIEKRFIKIFNTLIFSRSSFLLFLSFIYGVLSFGTVMPVLLKNVYFNSLSIKFYLLIWLVFLTLFPYYSYCKLRRKTVSDKMIGILAIIITILSAIIAMM